MGIEEEDDTNMQGSCNKLSICLAVLVMFLLLIIVFAACLLFFIGFTSILGFAVLQEECTNSSCIKASALISEIIDGSVDPCEDFYGFVCGNFEKIAHERQINNLLTAERGRVQRQLDAYIVEPAYADDPKPVRMQKAYFRSCLNEAEIDEYGNQTLMRKLLEIGDWPLLHRSTPWEEKNFEWSEVMIKARQLGLPFEWFFKVDLFNDENYELLLSQPENCGTRLTDEYFAMQRDILEKFTNAGIDTISEFTRLAQFERNLSNVCSNTSSDGNTLIRMLHLRLENVKTANFLNALTGLPYKWRPDSSIAFNRRYVFYLNRLLQYQKKDQANYILWKIIEYFAPYLSEPVRERYAEYQTQISGEDTTRFDFCLQDTKSRFKYVSEIISLQQYAESPLLESGKELIEAMKRQIVDYIESVEWRSNKTKESHLNFYDNLENIIGGPEEMFDESFLTNHLPVGKLVFFFDNIIQLITDWSQTTFESKMKMMGRKVTLINLDYVYEATADFVVILDDVEQLIIVPAAALNSFLYESDLPQYFNFAGLGTHLGRELIKRLELLTRGKHETYKGFEDNKKCLTDSFQKANKHLNSSVLFNINYGWMVAQELAYKAYQTYVESNEEEMQVINLPYTPNQLFWIKSSLKWCYHKLPEEKFRNMQEIYKYRILETVKHSPHFASDFNCTSEAHMNAKNKCQLL